ncbi:hypothetical protein PHLGIDRAFT_457132 [Phlebiopsis gigantea 11061_1 CR5-6]|uniref:PH domain-containing protein n=1 Tax=Phlebiopsis gigantea (strain 11061_1 CR5-6) TaxID=745531 RepID=A0A0C3SF75_PHLG1|nr:hypothetical protein PHLGIDRAFT_457132 [Phlebiopsis gigantea 11061_1 CR5-6]
MRGRYESPSETSSILSALPLNSRASSRTAIVTPLEDFRTSRYTKPDILPELTLGPSSVEGSSKSSAGSIHTGNVLGPGVHKSKDAEPYGPYFSIPIKATSKPALSRRGTTKELIGRYETLSTGDIRIAQKKPSPSPSKAHSHTAESKVEEKRGKGRSPIRQSFRSLLSVFSKKGKATRETSLHVSDLLEESEEYCSPGSKYEDTPRPTVSIKAPPTLQIPMDGPRLLDPTMCTTPIPLHSGQLHYLCNPVLPDGLPVWINCDVTLHSTHIVVTWRSASGNPSSSLVHLPQCTDVRSLSVTDLDPIEASLLPAGMNAGGCKIFELLFEGRVREKFAASSVKERAGWVSAVWDVVLHASEQRTPSLKQPPLSSPDTWGLPSPHCIVFSPRPESIKAAGVSVAAERELPPVPVAPSSFHKPPSATKIQLYDPPVSVTPPSIPQPSRPTVSVSIPPAMTPDRSTWSRLPTPGRQSPSIRNLDMKSMVKQRLAEFERGSPTSPSSSPARSTRTRQIVTSPVDATSLRQSVLLRHGTISSIGQDSVQSGSQVASPISPLSGRLAAIPSGHPVLNEEHSWLDRLSRLHSSNVSDRPDVFSPASRYSDGLPPTPTKSSPPILTLQTDMTKPLLSPSRLLSAHRQTFSDPAHSPVKQEPVVPSSTPPRVVASAPVLGVPPHSVAAPTISTPSELRPSTTQANQEQNARLSVIRNQISEVRTELRHLPETIGAVVADNVPAHVLVPAAQDEEAKRLLQGLDDAMKRVEDQGEKNVQGLTGIHTKVDALLELRQLPTPAGDPQPGLSQEAVEAIVYKLDELCGQIKTDMPALSQRLEELLAAKVVADVPPSDGGQTPPGETAVLPSSEITGEGITAVHDRLQEILSAIQASQQAQTKDDSTAANPLVEEILALIKAEQEKREEQATQQADSARYLNELNTWLETFVKHGTSQIESVAAGVQHLCKELGPAEAVSADGQPLPQEGVGLLAEVRQLLAESRQRGDHVGTLQMSVEGLAAAVHESIQAAEARNQLPTDTMSVLVEQQRQSQEYMLKALATELSNEIRGERLRFVEAMKEATTINVQIHVEEFKKELTREVLSMTQEVSRLQRERQTLEQQIADLFAFYAKQKQAGEAKQTSKKRERPPQGAPPSGRPLPNPSQLGYPGAM